MRLLSAVQMVWQIVTVGVPRRRRARRLRQPGNPRVLPEFRQVNQRSGREPLSPELSGLRLRSPSDAPPRTARPLAPLRYRWRPSGEFWRREEEMQGINRWRDRSLHRLTMLPPILLFPDGQEVAPRRHQPFAEQTDAEGDLRDLEAALQATAPVTIQPRLAELDPEYFHSYRHLLPRSYRRFLRTSPYPRVAAGLLGGVTIAGSVFWLLQLQQEAAVAAGRLHHARRVAHSEIATARAYGVSDRWLRPLEKRYRLLSAHAPASGIVINHARLQVYAQQLHAYTVLRQTLHTLERRAFDYWTWREGMTYAAVMEAHQYVDSMGLRTTLPPIPACAMPRCFRDAIGRQESERTRLLATGRTLRRLAVVIQRSVDPSLAAQTAIEQVHALVALLPVGDLPVAPAALDAAYAAATTSATMGQVGALADLDAGQLRTRLLHSLPATSVVVNRETEYLTSYVNGKVRVRAPVFVGTAVPNGRFSVQLKVASTAATYWRQDAHGYRYRYGAIPYWMAFSSTGALQGAPWRVGFGQNGGEGVAMYAPLTPASIDLPLDAAASIFAQIEVGTTVVVY